MYNGQTNAHLIESFILLLFIYRSYKFHLQHVILTQLPLGAC